LEECYSIAFFLQYRYTFEVAPFFMMIEYAILAHLRSFIGWEDGDGIFAPGIIIEKCAVY
jgi:hypothetical protein